MTVVRFASAVRARFGKYKHPGSDRSAPAYVVSPITGRIGVSQVTLDAYAQAGIATLMSAVQQIEAVYIDLTLSNLKGLKLPREIRQGRLNLVVPTRPGSR